MRVLHVPGESRIIQKIPLFSSLPQERLEALSERLIRKQYNRNEVVFEEDESTEFMYIVLMGKAKVVSYSVDGKEHILAIHKKGECFGEMALLDHKTAPASVIAMEETTLALLSRQAFAELFLADNKACSQIILHLCTRLREAWLMLDILNCPNAETRVRKVIGKMAQLYGVRDARGMLMPFSLKHKEIAAYANVSRETATRCLTRMRVNGEIDYGSRRNMIIRSDFDSGACYSE